MTPFIVKDNALTDKAKHTMLYEWNDTYSNFSQDKTIQQLFEEQVEKSPYHIAIVFNDQTLTYRELNDQANQVAHYLKTIGVTPNTCVGICLEPSLHLIIGILGILKAGAAYVPLDSQYPVERLQFMLEDANVSVVITQTNFANLLSKKNLQFVFLDTDTSKIAAQDISNPNVKEGNLAYVIFTSGSTGKPKGVMISHLNVCHFIHWFGNAIGVTSSDIFDFSSSISFDFTVATTIFPLTKGARSAICAEQDKKDLSSYIKHLITNKISVIKLTPSYFRQLNEYITPDIKLPNLRLIVFGGEQSFAKDIKSWLQKFPEHSILNEYGPTEATVATSCILLDKDNILNYKHCVPIGKPVFNSQLYILNSDLDPVPVGEIGELYIGGLGVGNGYLNRPEDTAEKFIQNPFIGEGIVYKTGDLCRFLADGNIEFVGRVDHQIKIRGFRIEIEEIENCLRQHPAIKDALVIAQEDQTGEKFLIAYFVAENNSAQSESQPLRDYLEKHLPSYMVPGFYVMLDKFPLNTNGKIDRNALPAPSGSSQQYYEEPHNELEKTIQKVWSQVLKINQISVNENFFELGGHSLSAARIISKLEKITKKEIHLQDFYNAPTIVELAHFIDKAKQLNSNFSIQKIIPTSKYIPLSEMQLMFWMIERFTSKVNILNIVDRRRIKSKLDSKYINHAFKQLLKKHEILTYHIPGKLPVQIQQDRINFDIEVENISKLSADEQNNVLIDSLNQLEKQPNWKKDAALIRGKLFYLGNDISELQIALSHLISDEVSPDIIFSDLSDFYIAAGDQVVVPQFKEYINSEKQNITSALDRDVKFWDTYLSDATLITFEPEMIMADPQACYSTYLEFPERLFRSLKKVCATERLSLADILCAATALVLEKYANNNLVINFVKSTRDNEMYDRTIGLFLRNDLIKVDISKAYDFIEVARNIQQSRMETAPYQFIPGIAKLASLLKKYWEDKKIRLFFFKIMTFLCAKILPKLKLNPRILMMYSKVFLAKTNDKFYINLNILNSFVVHNSEKKLFGYPIEPLNYIKSDKISPHNLLDISFDRNHQNKAYIIISGNLIPEFRKHLGEEIISMLSYPRWRDSGYS